MTEYQVLARRYRPKKFKEVVGQAPIVTTLKNAIRMGKTAQAYLFCGCRGTGKTTLARLYAMALNCAELQENLEPCNACTSCKEIAGGFSLDVLEIDGASHRGIDDIRRIKEHIGFIPTGNYKILLIDEVHMLTKEAFNALLKVLEEPPSKVKFFFATTEPHRIPETILSRCQRFDLHRIPIELIQQKLAWIAQDLQLEVDQEALNLIARLSEGGLRDAESKFDQVIAFGEGKITEKIVIDILGLVHKETFFAFDARGAQGDYQAAFELARQIFASGKNISFFLEELIEHFRKHLLTKLGVSKDAEYQKTTHYYEASQLIDILELLRETRESIKQSISERIAIEMLLLHIIRSHKKISIEQLVIRLEELEKKVAVQLSEEKSSVNTSFKEDRKTPSEITPLTASSAVEQEKNGDNKKIEKEPNLKTKNPQSHEQLDTSKNHIDHTAVVRKQSRYDTLIRFAAKELDGSFKPL